MRLKITRKNNSQTFTGVESLTMIKRGRLFPHVYVNTRFGKDASTRYISKERDISWDIDPNETPWVGTDFCEKVEVFEETEG